MDINKAYDGASPAKSKAPWRNRASKYIKKNAFFFLLLLPGTILILLFYYVPYYGLLMGFENFSIGKGVFHSEFVGFKNFIDFFSSVYFFRLLKNTFVLSFLSMLFTFPAPIIFALMLNEVKNSGYKRVIQTISYLPHFISTVILVGFVFTFFSSTNGILTLLIKNITGHEVAILGTARWFRTLYVGLGVYGSFGWDSIIFLAALSSVDPSLYEAAKIDGASRWQQMTSITLPAIMPPIVILMILRMGSLLDVGFETVYLMQTPAIYDVADVISTYVYRRGVLGMDFGYSTAVSIFNSVVSFGFVLVTNYVSKKVNNISLW
jgi:putative aldouronate transport system permease protein